MRAHSVRRRFPVVAERESPSLEAFPPSPNYSSARVRREREAPLNVCVPRRPRALVLGHPGNLGTCACRGSPFPRVHCIVPIFVACPSWVEVSIFLRSLYLSPAPRRPAAILHWGVEGAKKRRGEERDESHPRGRGAAG